MAKQWKVYTEYQKRFLNVLQGNIEKMLCSVRMRARNVYTFRSGGTVFCGYSEKLTILRNSHMSYYCLQHHLMNTAQLLTAHPTTTNRPTTVYQLICTRCTLLAESLRSSRLIQEDRRRLCQQGTPDVDNLNNLNVGTFGLPDHENYKRFSQ